MAMLEEDGGGRGDVALFRVALKCCARAGDLEGGLDGAAVADRVLEGMSAQGFVCGVEGLTDVAQVIMRRFGGGGGGGGGSLLFQY